MTREWKPGDVGVTGNKWGSETPTRFVVIQDATGAPRWVYVDGDSASHGPRDDARHLVVIDPEDFPQANRLALAYEGYRDMQVALRSLIADPKPEEPTGLGAVVETATGKRYIRTADTDCAKPWSYANNYTDSDWSDIDVVKVLSEGVTA